MRGYGNQDHQKKDWGQAWLVQGLTSSNWLLLPISWLLSQMVQRAQSSCLLTFMPSMGSKHSESNIQNRKCTKTWSIFSIDIILQVQKSYSMKVSFIKLLKILYITSFRLWVWSVNEMWMNFLFNLCSIPKKYYSLITYIHICVCLSIYVYVSIKSIMPNGLNSEKCSESIRFLYL
jgi:hypothetical protein